MVLLAVRSGAASLRGAAVRSFLTPKISLRPLACGIVSKTLRAKDYKRPVPFPYKDTPYGFWQSVVDSTMHRLDENSKIIVVDGPMAVGKTKFAKEVAEELDMHYMPEANMDMVYVNEYGFDIRTLDHKMPESCKSFDEKDFHANPNHRNVASFQIHMFTVRCLQYVDALAHVLSTGQGVVLDRSVFSDFVFLETLAHFGFVSKAVSDYYYECKKMSVPELMRPHLVIYLDCPAAMVAEKIKARGRPHEVQSKAITPQFLSYMEMVYKQHYLKQISTHAELLIYDWSEEGDTEVVVEDIERINFDVGKHNPKMDDWKIDNEYDWGEKRMLYTKGKAWIHKWMQVPTLKIPEMLINAEDNKIRHDVYSNAPGNKYRSGFNADVGDSFIYTKL